ncbi:transcriptional regulator [Paucilactobacillus sp. N302-9]
MEIDVKAYLEDHDLTIYQVAKTGGYGYTTIHKSFNKTQSDATSLNLRDLHALAQTMHQNMWEVLKELESNYLK